MIKLKATIKNLYYWIKKKLIRFKKWIILIIFGAAVVAAPLVVDKPKPPVDNIPHKKISIEEQLIGKDSKEKARIKSEAIAKHKIGKFTKGSLEIEIVGDIKAIKKKESHGIQLYARAWKNGKQLGFGKDGSVEIERFLVYDPIILVDDPNGDIVKEWTDIDGKIKQNKFREDPVEATKQDIAHTIGLVGKENTDITIGKIGSTVATFYPDADPESTSVDGYIDNSTAESWASKRAGSGVDAYHDGATIIVGFSCWPPSPNFNGLKRAIILFDTSALPDDATISGTTMSIYGSYKEGGANWANDDINIYTSTPNTNTTLIASDYSQLGSTAQCDTAITYDNYDNAGYNDFSFNATGIGNVSKTSISKFGVRTAYYDASNNDPGYIAYASLVFTCYSADNGSNKPKLVVTYTVSAERRMFLTQ